MSYPSSVEPSEKDTPVQATEEPTEDPSPAVDSEVPEAPPIIGHLQLEERHFIESVARVHHHAATAARKLILAALVLSTAVALIAWPLRPGVWTLLYPALVLLWLMPRQSDLIGREVYRGLHPAIRNATVIIDATQIRLSGDRVEGHQSWSHFTRWVETDALFILRGTGGASELWNKEAFDPEDLPRLRALLDAQIKPPATAPPATRRRLSASHISMPMFTVLLVLYIIWRSQ